MINKIAEKYKYENGVFLEVGKRGPRVAINSNDMIKILLDYFPIEQVQGKLNELVEYSKLKNSQQPEMEDVAERINQIVLQQDYIRDFKYLKINESHFTYYFQGNRAIHVQVGYPNTKQWVEILLKYKNKEISMLQRQMAPLLSPKAPYRITTEEVATIIANSLSFSLRSDLEEDLLGDIKPVTLSDSEEISLYKVNYEYKETYELGKYMKEFLSRVSDREYLCAIIWLMFNGQKSPYVVYLYGTGGEGKSSFLNVLANNVGSVAAFQSYNQFSNFNMYGKAMILLTENTNVYLLQDQVVKQLTGNSKVHCEEKHTKGSFTASLPGTLFADANKMLKLKGEDAEFRRLRIFKVSKPQDKEPLDMKTYEACLAENFNDFLNYCRTCFEKVGSRNGWLVPASKSQAADFKALTDKAFIHQSEQVLAKIFKDLDLEYADKGEIDSSLFWKAFYKLPEAKDKFLADNLKDYLFLHRAVSEVGPLIYGIQQKPSEHTRFILPTP